MGARSASCGGCGVMSRRVKRFLTPHYQDFTRIRSVGASTMLLVGGRDIGKSWGSRSIMLDTAASGRRFVFVRKFHNMITWRKNATLFVKQDRECIEKIGGTVDFPSSRMAFVNTETDEVIGWATSLEDAYDIKGEEFPGIKTIVFDEFLDDSPMQNEFELYQYLIGTLTKSQDDVEIFLLANTVTRDNCYFRNFGIDIARMKPGDIAVVNHELGATVAIEYCRSSVYINPETGRASNKYVGFDASPASRMIMYGEWAHPPIETREIDGNTWASERSVLPVLVYIQGSFFEMSLNFSGETAYVRRVHTQKEKVGENVRKIITSEFGNTFKRADGSIVPKYLTFASTGNDALLESVRLFRRFRQAGRIIGTDPIDTHDFLRFFDSMPL